MHSWLKGCFGNEDKKVKCLWIFNADNLLGKIWMVDKGWEIKAISGIPCKTCRRLLKNKVYAYEKRQEPICWCFGILKIHGQNELLD